MKIERMFAFTLYPFPFPLFPSPFNKMNKPKKWKKFRVKRLLILGMCNLTSGIVFGAGCLVAEHIDNNWWQTKEVSSPDRVVYER